MLDILQLRISPDELGQLRLCQVEQRNDCHAAFTVQRSGAVWPRASWGDAPGAERFDVRGWFPILDQIADEFLLWWPQGGCFFVSRDAVTHRLHERDTAGVLFLQLEVNRLHMVPRLQNDVRQVNPAIRFISR
jgi:hypothetical protein